jgi:oxygen-independent coproporphyrinogen III oxidase
MAGIYIHIPYCKQKCHYCNFYSFASKQYRDHFVKVLLSELTSRRDYLGDAAIGSIYFGGGTPSMLTPDEINKILTHINNDFQVDPHAEITLEANPDDLDDEKLSSLKSTAINRLSIGVQSFFDDDLKYLNRVHDGDQAKQSIELAGKHGFEKITIDLIYGIPTLTRKKWIANLAQFFAFGISHLSAYSLTVEPGTALQKLINRGRMKAVDEQQSIHHFKQLLRLMRDHGYIHYEISNFALEGHYSKHNSIYWVGGHYLGVGPSAHSFNGYSREWNVSNMREYMESDTMEKKRKEREILSPEQQYNEYVMTSLRTSWGCDIGHITNVFGEDRKTHFEQGVIPFLQEGKVRQEGPKYYLTDKGKLYADGISSELFI